MRDVTPNPPPMPQMQFQLNGKLILLGIAALLLIIGFYTGAYTVSPESEGVVQRFGKFKNVVKPGLHFKIPFGVDKVTIIPVKRQLKFEFGFGSSERDALVSNSRNKGLNSRLDGDGALERNMLTGDLNASQVEWVVQYEISNPVDFLFNLREPGPTLRDLSESVMREVVGDRTVDEVLTVGRQGVENDAIIKLRTLVEKLEMGLRVTQIQLKNVNPPTPVQQAFEEVNRAQQEREQMINQANGEYNKVVPKARGEAEQKISEAEGYAIQRVNEAEGDVAKFVALLKEYEKAPEVTRQRLYLETMARVIPSVGGKIVLDENAQQFLPLMQLKAPSTKAAQ